MAGLSSSLFRLLLLLSMSPHVFAFPSRISIRDATCSSASGLEACPSQLPSNFCCPQGATCMALAGDSTAVCCPKGMTCDKIQPITCDLTQQDPSVNASVAIKTSVFDVALGSCGSGLCCPFGYSCADGKECRKNSDQSKSPAKETSSSPSSPSGPTSAPSSSAPPTSSAPTSSASSSNPAAVAPTPSSPSSMTDAAPSPIQLLPPSPTIPAPGGLVTSESSPAVTTPPAAAEPTLTTASEAHASNPKTMSIVGGVVGASVVLAVIGMVAFLMIRRSRHPHHQSSPPSMGEKGAMSRLNHHGGPGATGSAIVGNKISDPIEQGNSFRTDFILKRLTKVSTGRSSNSGFFSKGPAATAKDQHQRPPTTRFSRPNLIRRLTIPNPFDSPSPSRRSPTPPTPPESSASPGDDANAIHGRVAVGARLKPIRAMKVSSARVTPQTMPPPGMMREPSSENINVFADPYVVAGAGADWRMTRGTTFTDLMDEADLGDVRRGKPYVPRLVSGV